MWAIAATHITQNFGFYVLLTELPTYLNSVLGWDLNSKVSKKNNYCNPEILILRYSFQAFLSGLPYLCQWIVSVTGSVLVDILIEKKLLSTTIIRKIANTIATIGPGLALLGQKTIVPVKKKNSVLGASFTGAHPASAFALLTVACGCNGLIYSGNKRHI